MSGMGDMDEMRSVGYGWKMKGMVGVADKDWVRDWCYGIFFEIWGRYEGRRVGLEMGGWGTFTN